MTTEPVVVRAYQASDFEACLAAFLTNVPTYFAESEVAEFTHFLASHDVPYLVAEVEGRIVGCGGWAVDSPGAGRLCWGLVHRDCHRLSIGSVLLVARIEALFADEDIAEVGIDTSQLSAGFFERFGFVSRAVVQDGLAPGLHLVSMQLARSHWTARPDRSLHQKAFVQR